MNSSILFVINPIAGDVDKNRLHNTIDSWAQSSAKQIHYLHTTGENDEQAIEEKISECQPGIVMSVGGDGTLKLCAGILKNRDIALGMVPMGSANGMAAELDLPKGIDASLKLLEDPHFQLIDLLVFNDDELGLHISDIGLNAELVKSFDEGERRGFLGYAENLFENFKNQKEFEVTIDCDESKNSSTAVMVAIGNAKTYGTGALLNHKGQIDDGLMELCIIRKLGLGDIAEHVITLPDDDSDHLEVIQCREAVIRCNQKIAFQIDGEVRPKTNEVKVSVLPKALKMLIPKNNDAKKQ